MGLRYKKKTKHKSIENMSDEKNNGFKFYIIIKLVCDISKKYMGTLIYLLIELK